MKPSRPGKVHASPTIACLLALLGWLAPRAAQAAAVFDFTPLNGTISAVYIGGASGNVAISISGANGVSVPSGSTQNITVNNGIVAWSDSTKVYYYAFDPSLGQWRGESVAGTSFDIRAVDGIVAWSTGGPGAAAFCRAYDPLRRAWRSGGASGAILNSEILDQHGVVAWNTSAAVHYQTYDPVRGTWQTGSTAFPANKAPADLVTADGIVAWSISTGTTTSTVYYRIYDPQSGTWAAGSNNNNSTTGLTITDALISWSTSSGNFFRGYNGVTRQWQSGSPVPVAYFVASTNAGNQPLVVNFIDMSLGPTAWSWSFGDGGTSNRRSPTYRYTSFGRYAASLGINGNSSSTSQTILTDITFPSGTISINGGASFVTNHNVTLALSATDNSGVTAMRFNNDGGDWTGWEPFATARAWSLNTNNGTRTVSVQYRDVALNTSATVSASIQLDSSPLPVVSLVGTNLSENAGLVSVVVALDRTYTRPVAVSYATSNGTATAGQDYTGASGQLIFPANARTLTIPLTILQDSLLEPGEVFRIHFTAISNVVAGLPGEVVILDDEIAALSFAQGEFSANESNDAATVSVRLNGPSSLPVRVSYIATNGTATADVDYLPVVGELFFPPGTTNQNFTVPLINDAFDEFPETVHLQLFSVTNAVFVGSTNAILLILDDDKPVVFFSQATYPAYESDASSVVKISVRLSKPYSEEVNVECAVTGLTASPGDDYDQPAVNIALRYLAGQTNKDISLVIRPDAIREPRETIQLTLTEFSGGSPGPITTATVVIYDNDSAPLMENVTVNSGGQFSATFVGTPGQTFAVERSTNLLQWVELSRLTNTTGTLEFSLPIPPGDNSQFFRTRLIP